MIQHKRSREISESSINLKNERQNIESLIKFQIEMKLSYASN